MVCMTGNREAELWGCPPSMGRGGVPVPGTPGHPVPGLLDHSVRGRHIVDDCA